MSVNVRGVFLCLKHEIPLMLETAGGQGAIVITSSTAGMAVLFTVKSTLLHKAFFCDGIYIHKVHKDLGHNCLGRHTHQACTCAGATAS